MKPNHYINSKKLKLILFFFSFFSANILSAQIEPPTSSCGYSVAAPTPPSPAQICSDNSTILPPAPNTGAPLYSYIIAEPGTEIILGILNPGDAITAGDFGLSEGDCVTVSGSGYDPDNIEEIVTGLANSAFCGLVFGAATCVELQSLTEYNLETMVTLTAAVNGGSATGTQLLDVIDLAETSGGLLGIPPPCYTLSAIIDYELCVGACSVAGCTDACASNYDPDATEDNGSCMEYSTDCPTDSGCSTFVWNATTCSCEENAIPDCLAGCMDPCSSTYNASATIDDGSCEAYSTDCPVNTCFLEYTWDQASCECITAAIDYNCDDMDECTTDTVNETSCECEFTPIENCGEVLGCTDPCAPNYNPDATLNDDSCEAFSTDCPANTCFAEFSWDATNCSCLEVAIEVAPCDDSDACTTDTFNETSCECEFTAIENCGEILGCTDPCAPNYNPEATLNDDSCEAYSSECPANTCFQEFAWDQASCSCITTDIEAVVCDDGDDCTTDTLNETSCECEFTAIPDCGGTEPVAGCTDPCAPNYNPNATSDDGSCTAYDSNCDDGIECTTDSFNASTCSCSNIEIPGCDTVGEGANDIPTLSQWGVILFVLLLLNFGSITIYNEQLALSRSSSNNKMNTQLIPFNSWFLPFTRDEFLKGISIGLVIIFAWFATSLAWYGFITNVDLICSFICLPVFAYLVQLFSLFKDQENN